MTIHLAGPAITFRGYRRQRCLWCGTPIIDEDLTRIAMPISQLKEAEAKGHDPHPAWKDGSFVEITGTNARCYSLVDPDIDPDDGSVIVPGDSCMQLPPEMTGERPAESRHPAENCVDSDCPTHGTREGREIEP